MELKNKKIHANSPISQSIGTAFLRAFLNLSLLVLLKLYFFIPDVINKTKKYAFKKKTEADSLRRTISEENITNLSKLKNSL